MLTLAFHALLRIGEYTKTTAKVQHTLQLRNISLLHNQASVGELHLTIPHYKHSCRPVTLSIKASLNSTTCPVFCMRQYLHRRTKNRSPCLFVTSDGRPVLSSSFASMFRSCIVYLGLDTAVYKPHSLRIGGASLAHDLNYSDAQIQSLGRWHSTSYQRYIRVPVLSASN